MQGHLSEPPTYDELLEELRRAGFDHVRTTRATVTVTSRDGDRIQFTNPWCFAYGQYDPAWDCEAARVRLLLVSALTERQEREERQRQWQREGAKLVRLEVVA